MAKIVIDAGHGGTDIGISANGIIEKDVTLAISKHMERGFQDLGIPVKMTRTSDETLSPSDRVEKILNAYGDCDDVYVISNHINSGGDGTAVIYALRDTNVLPGLILDDLSREGKNVIDPYTKRLPSNPSKDYYTLQRETGKTHPITVEYGYLDSFRDDESELNNNYSDYADIIVRAVAKHLNIPYTKFDNENVGVTYTVSTGDTLWSIAKKYSITVDELKAANYLTSNLLKTGQILNIPVPGTNIHDGGIAIYSVGYGDSLYKIAGEYNTTVEQLKRINNLTSDLLSIGQNIFVPLSKKCIIPAMADEIMYTVKPGDNLYSIAREYGKTIDELMDYNNLRSNLLNIGQVIRIPFMGVNTIYSVKSGDNLYQIAQQFGTTVDNLMKKNNLSSSVLSIGQVLNI